MSEDADHDYRYVHVPDLPDGASPARHKWEVDEAVGASAFGMNVYEAAPGEALPWGRHHHPDHEELFYVLDGRLRVETATGERELGPEDVLFVPAGAPNRAVAVGDAVARVVAVGAPKGSDDAVVAEHCPDCDAVTERAFHREDGHVVGECAVCGTETTRFAPGPD